jgi:hypothetical protein
MLDGECCWGSMDIRPDRFGAIRYRLVVYPPGISETERRRVRVWRGWPLWGALLWIVSEIWLGNLIAPWPAFAISSAASLGSGAVALALAGDARTRVRTMGTMVVAGPYEPTSAAVCRKVQTLAESLAEADAQREQGQISAIDHEVAWWRVYDQMPARRIAAPGVPSPGRAA